MHFREQPNLDLNDLDEIEKGQKWQSSQPKKNKWNKLEEVNFSENEFNFVFDSAVVKETPSVAQSGHKYSTGPSFGNSGFFNVHSSSSRQQLDPALADSEHVNGFSCWHCRERSYANCQSRGQLAYCQDEQFHCYVHEKRQYGEIIKLWDSQNILSFTFIQVNSYLRSKWVASKMMHVTTSFKTMINFLGWPTCHRLLDSTTLDPGPEVTLEILICTNSACLRMQLLIHQYVDNVVNLMIVRLHGETLH